MVQYSNLDTYELPKANHLFLYPLKCDINKFYDIDKLKYMTSSCLDRYKQVVRHIRVVVFISGNLSVA